MVGACNLWAPFSFNGGFTMKMRTIANAYQYIKDLDPDTDISPYLIRKLAEQEKISLTKTGNKVLVDVDSLIDYLNGVSFTPTILKIL